MLTKQEKEEIKYALNYYRADLAQIYQERKDRGYCKRFKIEEEILLLESLEDKIVDCA